MVLTDGTSRDADEEIPSGWEDDTVGQGEGNTSPVLTETHHVRTPPPSGRIFRRFVILDQETARSDSLVADESELPIATQSNHNNVLPGQTASAPTTMEFRVKRDSEVKDIYGGRKRNPSEKGDLVKGAKRIGDFQQEVQGVMAVMKASMLHTYVARAGFCEDETVSLQRAKEYAKEHLTNNVDAIVDIDFIKTVSYFPLVCCASLNNPLA